MNGIARLLAAVVALLFFCPAIYPEPVSLWQDAERNQGAAPQVFHTTYSFTALATEILVDGPGHSQSRTAWTALHPGISLDEILRQLVHPSAENVTGTKGTLHEAPSGAVALASAGRSGEAEKVRGFYNEEIYQAWQNMRRQISLEILFPLLGGPLFFDTLSDPGARFTFQPGSVNLTQATFLVNETQRAGDVIIRLWEQLSYDQLQPPLLILLGFALALLPALLRRLKFLTRFLPSMPGRVKKTVALLRNEPEIITNQIEIAPWNSENNMAKPRRTVVKRDESWRKAPPVTVAPPDAATAPAVAQVLPQSQTNGVASSRRRAGTTKAASNRQSAAVVNESAEDFVERSPVYRGASRSQRRQPSGRNGAATRINGVSPSTRSVPAVSAEELALQNGSAEDYALPSDQEVADYQANGSLAKSNYAEPDFSTTEVYPSFADEQDVLEIETIPLYGNGSQGRRAKKKPEPEPLEPSFTDLRTSVMLQWLESRVPAVTEAVAWEEEHLGEYRGLPFAEPVMEETPGETDSHHSP